MINLNINAVMKLKYNIVIMLILTLSCLASAADNIDLNKKFYFQLNVGNASGLAPKGNYGNNKSNKAILFGGELGYKFNNHLRLGLGIDYIPKMLFKEKVDSDEDTTDNSTYKVKSFAAMVNAYYDLKELNKFTPYFTIGAGIAINKTSGSHYTIFENEVNPDQSIPAGKKTNFAYKLGLGCRYTINHSFALDVRYQFVDLGKLKTGTNEEFDELHHGKLQTNQLLLGIVYKF